jgi:hypothetical protein
MTTNQIFQLLIAFVPVVIWSSLFWLFKKESTRKYKKLAKDYSELVDWNLQIIDDYKMIHLYALQQAEKAAIRDEDYETAKAARKYIDQFRIDLEIIIAKQR